MYSKMCPFFFPQRLALGALLLLIQFSGLAFVTPANGSDETNRVLDVGNSRQMFIDGRFFATSNKVELVVHQPKKTGERTIVADRPWEKEGIDIYCCAMQVGAAYHLWYPTDKGLCYARSKDGIKWDKPNLGLAEFQGSRENNIVIGRGAGGIEQCGSEGTVFYDGTAPEDQRFRYATRISDELKGTMVFSSPDGIHFRQTHTNILTFTQAEGRQHLDSQNIIFWDDRINKYVAYMRRNQFKPAFRGRSVARSESDRLGGFPEVQDTPIVLTTDALDATLGGKPVVDYYTSGAMKYPWAQDVYFIFPQVYFHYLGGGVLGEFPKQAPVNSGPLDTQFGASRDGITWQRFGRRPYVSLGMKGDFDSKNARVFSGLVLSVDGREMYQYYLGSDTLHGWGRDERNNRLFAEAGLAPEETNSVVSRLVLRRDGFISVRAAYEGGEFITPLMRFSGSELSLNVDTSATGLLRCELLGENNKPIEGYALGDCDMIHTANDIDRVVKWKGHSILSGLAGKPVRVRVVFRDTDLYAFQFK